MHAGGLFIYPRLGLQEFYNDNIFATDSDEEDDFITLVSPRVDVTSDWTKHAFDLYAKAAIGVTPIRRTRISRISPLPQWPAGYYTKG